MWAQLLISILGEGAAAVSEEQAKAMLQKSMDAYGRLHVPTLQQVAAQELGPSAFDSIQEDPKYGQMEKQSLDELARIGKSGGMTLEDRANLASITGQTNRNATANNNRIAEQMASRGIRGGGAQLAMQLANNQAQAQRAYEGGLQTSANAEKRALDSIIQGGQMAGQMRSQDYGMKAKRAEAADARERYNADARTRANMYNSGLGQQQFENQMRLTGAQTGQGDKMGQFYTDKAASDRQLYAGLGKAANDYTKSNKKSREDDDEFDYGWGE